LELGQKSKNDPLLGNIPCSSNPSKKRGKRRENKNRNESIMSKQREEPLKELDDRRKRVNINGLNLLLPINYPLALSSSTNNP